MLGWCLNISKRYSLAQCQARTVHAQGHKQEVCEPLTVRRYITLNFLLNRTHQWFLSSGSRWLYRRSLWIWTQSRDERGKECALTLIACRTTAGERRRGEAMQLEIETRWSAWGELELSNRSIWGPMEPFTAKSLERTLAICGVEGNNGRISRACFPHPPPLTCIQPFHCHCFLFF